MLSKPDPAFKSKASKEKPITLKDQTENILKPLKEEMLLNGLAFKKGSCGVQIWINEVFVFESKGNTLDHEEIRQALMSL